MKLTDIYENADIEIVDVEIDDTTPDGSHKLTTINVRGSDLMEVFGEPQDHTRDERADINYIWDLTIKFREAGEDYEGDSDIAFVSIYDYRYGAEQTEAAASIDNWTVGGRNWKDGYVLNTLLMQKGLLK